MMSLKISGLNPAKVEVDWEGTLRIDGKDLGTPGFVAIEGKEQKIEKWEASFIKVYVTKDITKTAGSKRVVVHDKDGNFDETQWQVEKKKTQTDC